ncbi:kinase-like domain-containing protein [Gigaspora rosea]|uniref:Kinase-like domain-containing protein n=1 Tax=Gigaspora rosea TaxID=44941 RepID=A0A397U3A7_9GLOM|nr:kinase-like domain-containing protein [Gigaspora rosea]
MDSKEYILVLKYASKGSLRDNLQDVSQMEWEHKLELLNEIISNLEAIHSQGYIHRDLHSGNILQDNLHNAYISDLGLSSSDSAQKQEILMGQPYTTKSDIYSFGIIMWEILYGMPVSYYHNFSKQQLQLKICNNYLRPPISEEAPRCYVNLMKKCWDKEPEKRPPAEKLCKIFMKWQNDKNILSELKKSKINLENIEKSYAGMFSGGSKFISFTGSILGSNSGLQNLKIDDIIPDSS